MRKCSHLGLLSFCLKILTLLFILILIEYIENPILQIYMPGHNEIKVILISTAVVSTLVLSFKCWKKFNKLCQYLIVPLSIICSCSAYAFICMLFSFRSQSLVTDKEGALMTVATVYSFSFLVNIFISYSFYKLYKSIYRSEEPDCYENMERKKQYHRKLVIFLIKCSL